MPSWLERAFTLPKSKNSLADILGTPGAEILKKLARKEITDQVDGVLNVVGQDYGAARQKLLVEVNKVLEGELHGDLAEALSKALAVAIPDFADLHAESVRHDIIEAICRILGV